jgi:hypothetical protein
MAAPKGSNVEINKRYRPGKDIEQWGTTVVLSAAGYPLVRTTGTAPICRNPYSLTEALDAWRSNDPVETINGCTILPSNTIAEWTVQENALGLVELRMAMADGTHEVFFGPGAYEGGGFEQWLGVFPK